MSKTKMAAILDEELAEALDRFVASRPRNECTELMEAALAKKVSRLAGTLLARERAASKAAAWERGRRGSAADG